MKKILILLSIVSLLASCEDTKEIIQPGELGASDAFNNTEDLATGVFGIYSAVDMRQEIRFTSFFTDEVAIGASNGGQGLPLHEGVLNPNSPEAEDIWADNYLVIFRANTLISASNSIVPEVGEEATYDQAVGEALALRAYAFSRLLAFFGEDLQDDNTLGAILIDFPADASTQLPRGTIGETYDFILDDLNRAEQLLTSSGAANDKFRVSVDFVRALRARVANYRGDDVLATSSANTVLSSFSLPATADPAEYSNLWGDVSGAASQEIIFNLDVTRNTGPTLVNIYNTNSSDRNGGAQFDMSRELFNILEANSNNFGDIRRDIFVDISSLISPTYMTDVNPRDTDEIIIDKYPGDPVIGGLDGELRNDQKVIRTAEMHFILAEVAARNSDFNEVARQIDLVRNARYTTPVTTPVYSSQEEAFQDILLERRIELFAEGHRYIDVRRLGRLANVGYDRDEIDCTLYQSALCDRPATDTETRYMPIPTLEFTGNTAVAGQQNPGY
ncbi:RagB/SusD family nutrient uptake outer membrane protein [Nonlabens sp. Asnod3-A02]|uniref:RagB/SusD family nutrient uptake outer membrane protein n=1 Tax=Nonlabens sp. Asnod3-A02 TaxID=3160579 RepID=UPI00386AA4A8